MDRFVSKFRRYAGVLVLLVAGALLYRFAVMARRPIPGNPASLDAPSNPIDIPTATATESIAEPVPQIPQTVQQICGCQLPSSTPLADSSLAADSEGFPSGPSAERADETSPAAIRFEREIRPVFVDHCYQCHGPQKQEAGIRFDKRDGNFATSASGLTPLVPGNPLASSVITRLTESDPHLRMPLDADPLSEEHIAVLRQWISDGAEWPGNLKHWAFRKPVLPPQPALQGRSWCRNGIDDFVLAKLETAGLKPAAEADRVTLARRLSLDLTGLPPTPADVDAFVADTDSDAYEHFVDRLLESPHYGEKWALRWLDLTR